MLKQLISSEDGVSAIEYALIAALIALAIIGALATTGLAQGGLWARWSSTFLQAIGAGGS